MKLPSVYPLTIPSSHSTSRITAIVNSIFPPHPPIEHGAYQLQIAVCGSVLTYSGCIRMSHMRHSRAFRAALAAALFLSFLPATPSAQIDTSLFAGLRWRSIGPNRGGRSQASAGSASRPLEYYFGATGGGVWKTTDGGLTWRPVSDKQIKTSSVGALAIAPSNP